LKPSKLSSLLVRPGALAHPATANVASSKGAARSDVDMRRESFNQNDQNVTVRTVLTA
jgi:hypothetical protein